MKLTLWFDVHSPWCYLAAQRVVNLAARHGLELLWRPLHLPRLMDAIGGVKPLEATPVRVAWFKQDILDWAELQNMPFSYHPQYPLRNSRALRACAHAADVGKAEAFVLRVLTAYWSEQGDISDLENLERWAAQSGIDPQATREAALSDIYKQRIDDNTAAAIARGVFGVPTVDTGTKLYFGNDRLDLLDRHLTSSNGSRS